MKSLSSQLAIDFEPLDNLINHGMNRFPPKSNQLITYRTKEYKYVEQCADIMRSLPDYFYECEIDELFEQYKQNNCHLIIVRKPNLNSKAVGFLNLMVIDHVAKIANIAVKNGYRSKGIGTELIKSAARRCKTMNINSLFVETLDDSCDWPFYDDTRKFYRKNIGFEDYEVNQNPTWKIDDDDIALILKLDVNNFLKK